MSETEKSLYRLMGLIVAGLAGVGLLCEGPRQALVGLWRLQLQPARLVNDFTLIAGCGATLLNVAIMGGGALLLVRSNRVRLSGPTIAAIFTIMGFSFFGKTPLNTAPIMTGVYVASRVAGKQFRGYILIALFGTALGPLVSFLVAEAGFAPLVALLIGVIAGVAAGFVLPAVAVALLRLHEGYNLYNIGFTSGFLALFAAAFLKAGKHPLDTSFVWNTTPHPVLILLVPLLSLLLGLWGVAMDRGALINNLRRLLKEPGRLPSDFIDLVSPGAALFNAALLGALGSLYLLCIGADVNGPTIGGLLTIMGFATFGKHLRNCWPIAVGVVGATVLLGSSPAEPAPLLALLFGTTLAPLAGQFGWVAGVGAGFVHLCIVLQTTMWHGGLTLYNNGFAGGLTASFFIAVITWFKSNKRP